MYDSRSRESWTWYGVATFVVILRFTIRFVSNRLWDLDDYVMFLAFGFYTNLIAWVNIQSRHPHTNILPPSGLDGLSAGDIEDRSYGSKITFVIEESMVMVQSLCKLCMCLLYLKLMKTAQTKRTWAKIALGYVILGWFITELFFFGIWCRPFLNYFRVFVGNNPQCTMSQHHLIMSFTFNISSDVLILLVPVPMVLHAQMTWQRKATVLAVFSLGIFVIIAATLSRYYCFAKPDSILWIFWYVREASTAIIVVNMPHFYAIFRQIADLRLTDRLFGRTHQQLESQNQPQRWHPNGTKQATSKSTSIPLSGISFHHPMRESLSLSGFRTLIRGSQSTEHSSATGTTAMTGPTANVTPTTTNSKTSSTHEKEKNSSRHIVQRTEYSVTTVDCEGDEADSWDQAIAKTVIQGGVVKEDHPSSQ